LDDVFEIQSKGRGAGTARLRKFARPSECWQRIEGGLATAGRIMLALIEARQEVAGAADCT
jgi:hypothetical protein